MMSLRNYVAKCLNDNESLRNQVGDSFEAIDQFTKQIVELHNDGVSAEEVLALAAHQSNARLSVLGSLLQLVEQRLGKRYTFPEPPMKPYVHGHSGMGVIAGSICTVSHTSTLRR